MSDHVVGIDGVQDAKDFGKVRIGKKYIFTETFSSFQVGWGQFAFSFIQIVIGIGMVCFGYIYL